MTCNVGSHKIMSATTRDKAVTAVTEELNRTFRPEFLNRIDDKVVFDPLSRENMDHILNIQLKRLQRLLDNRELQLHVQPHVQRFVMLDSTLPLGHVH